MRALILYHFYCPDDVVSAALYSDLAEDLVALGWDVEVRPSNRPCHAGREVYGRCDDHNGVAIRRIWRPPWPQHRLFARLANTVWMVAAWSFAAFRHSPDILIVGSDPVLSVAVALTWRIIRPRTRIVHWCFDLYPEAAVADGLVRHGGFTHRLFRRLAAASYRRCDSLIDIGSCMRERLSTYPSRAHRLTITPWALVEPATPPAADPAEREALFGNAALGVLYSGTFGRAHSCGELLALARALEDSSVRFAFSVRGNRESTLRAAAAETAPGVAFVPFAPAAQIDRRLAAADIHAVSLHPEWTGLVVPSKFFGALAAGRPVLFAGSPDSAIARWIEEYGLGWVLTPRGIAPVAAQLRVLAADPARLADLQRHCHRVYHERFSRRRSMAAWNAELRALQGAPEAAQPRTGRENTPARQSL
jgi:glycosyltransferase involved in cell wall biosynthesis